MAVKKSSSKRSSSFKDKVQSVLSELGVKTVQPAAQPVTPVPPARCKPTAHRFLPVKIPTQGSMAAASMFAPKEVIKLFCSNCGEMRPID